MSKNKDKSRKKKMDLVDDVVKEPEVVEDKETLQEKSGNATNKEEKTKEEKVSFLTHIKEKFYSLWSKNKQKKEKRGLTEDQLRRLKESEEQNKNRPDDYETDPTSEEIAKWWWSKSQKERDDIEFKDIDNMPLLRRYNKKDGR